jgi:hypothetical protein
MAIIVQTSSPKVLLSRVKQAIDAGHIATWSYDSDGDFTHTPKQWGHQAWLRPIIVAGALQFRMIGNTHVKTTDAIYGVYLGRFIEEMLAHFGQEMQSVMVTPAPVPGVDNITRLAVA